MPTREPALLRQHLSRFMRWSQLYIPTLREPPQDAELVSHQLMIRSGMMRKLSSGIYSFLPMGWKVIQKMSQIIRMEMNRAGAQEVSLPVVQPKELWEKSGRWGVYGKELLRLTDRHNNEFCLQPTAEEVITDLLGRDLNSYRQLPLNLYQIQTKFRDEIRPRFGVMRGREFIMKDAYSFDVNEKSALASYDRMRKAYRRIFTRTGLDFRAVKADNGSIGGSASEEFMVLAQSGEDEIIFDPGSEYAANQEMADSKLPLPAEGSLDLLPEEFATPGLTSIAQLAQSLGQSEEEMMKTMVATDEDQNLYVLLLRGDHELNLVKLQRAAGRSDLRLAQEDELKNWKLPKGSLGPHQFPHKHRLIVDTALSLKASYVSGANKEAYHFKNIILQRDADSPPEQAVLRNVKEGEPSRHSKEKLKSARGIEVGHVFYLGTKYSEAMNLKFKNEAGRETLVEMGCFGIGVGRSVAAAIEQNHDDWGICWPLSLAPFELGISFLGEGEVVEKATELYEFFRSKGVDVVFDDRDLSPGVKLKDMDLLGIPYQIIVGDRSLKEGKVEWKARKDNEKKKLDFDEIRELVLSTLKQEEERIESLCESVGY